MGSFHIRRLNPNAVVPKRGTKDSAGYDLSSAEHCIIPAKGKGIVKTGLAMPLPEGVYARIAPRSGLAAKRFIDVGAGVVDRDYRGEVGIVLFNHSDSDFVVHQGDRIAQLILEKIATPEIQEVQNLDDTSRGESGFGSTGVHVKTEEQDQATQDQSSRLNVLKRLSKTNKPHILSKFKASAQRTMISVKSVKKLARNNIPMFLAIVRRTEEQPVEEKQQMKKGSKKSAFCKMNAHGMTEGERRKEMKMKGPKKDFKSVEEKEQELIQSVAPAHRLNLQALVREFHDVFPESLPKGRPKKRDVEHEIRIEPGFKPPNRPPYRLGPAEQDELEIQIKDLLAQGFIRPSSSPYGAPVLFVPKKDGRWRMCVD